MKKTIPLLLAVVSWSSISQSAKVTFQDAFYLRSQPVFDMRNLKTVVGAISDGEDAELLETMKTPGDNLGIKIHIKNGPHRGETAWVYYDLKNPNITIMENGKRLTGVELLTYKAKDKGATKQEPKAPVIPPAKKKSEGSVAEECETCKAPTPRTPIDNVKDALSSSYTPAFLGALKTMAVMYQSCDAIRKDPYEFRATIDDELSFVRANNGGHSYRIRSIPSKNQSQVIRDHYYLDKNGPDNRQCRDMRPTPPIYTYGGWPKVSKNNIDILQTHRPGGVPYTGLDCSSFINTSLSAAGLAVKPYGTVASNALTSTDYARLSDRNSCFASPRFSGNDTIKSGDILAWSGHVIMIDKVGNDPFGLEKMRARGVKLRSARDCDYNMPRNVSAFLNFDLIQSAGLGSLAIMRNHASQYLTKQGLGLKVYDMAVAACKANVGSPAVPDRDAATLIRHKGSSQTGCTLPKKATLTGEQCVAQCT
jgi:hypothetical protein